MNQEKKCLSFTLIAFCFFSIQVNAFDGVIVEGGSEVRLAFQPLGSVEINSANSYWRGTQDNLISQSDYDTYVDSKIEKLKQGDPDAFKTLASSPVRENRENTKLKLGLAIGRNDVEFSAYRTWSWSNETSIAADTDAFYRLQEQGYGLQPIYDTEEFNLGEILDFSVSENDNMCMELPADSPVPN